MNEKLVQLRGKGRYGEALTILGILWDNRGPIQTYVSVRGSVKEALAKQAREMSDGEIGFANPHET